MDSPAVIWVLRLIHVLSGVFWVGSVVFLGNFILPTARALGPAAGPFLNHLIQVRKLPRAQLGAAIATLLSGLGLYWRASVEFSREWMGSGPGMVFGIGAALAIAAFVVGVTVNLPTSKRIAELGSAIQSKGGPPDAAQADLLQRLQKRMGAAVRIVMLLLVLATAAMAVARYA